MGTSYVKRFRMEIDVAAGRFSQPVLPPDYFWLPWHYSLLDRHAAVKCHSFHDEIDAHVFSCLRDYAGCLRLMSEIAKQYTFLPQATWLITHRADQGPVLSDCGTIQGLMPSRSVGSVQNVGVAPEHRGIGLGRALVLKALEGFRSRSLRRVYLEVTASNLPAVELYRSIGFRLTRTMYKAVETEPLAAY
jgi:GNAT superfamily N-acetyltransferase